MKKFVATLGLGLLLGCFGACGSDSGTPRIDGGGPDGGKAGSDGGGSSEAGHATYDGGNKSEANPVNHADAGANDGVANVDFGIVVVVTADGGTVPDAPSNPDQAADSSLHVVVVDGGTDAPALLDVSVDGPAVIDVGRVDTGSLSEVGIDSSGVIDGSAG